MPDVTPAQVTRVRAAICAEIDKQIGGQWSLPFSLDAVARAAARAAVDEPAAPDMEDMLA